MIRYESAALRRPKLYIPSIINTWRRCSAQSPWPIRNGLVLDREACKSRKTWNLEVTKGINNQILNSTHPQNLISKRNNQWSKPWFIFYWSYRCSTCPLVFGCCKLCYVLFSQAEKEKTACKAVQIHKMTTIFTQKTTLGHFEWK